MQSESKFDVVYLGAPAAGSDGIDAEAVLRHPAVDADAMERLRLIARSSGPVVAKAGVGLKEAWAWAQVLGIAGMGVEIAPAGTRRAAK